MKKLLLISLIFLGCAAPMKTVQITVPEFTILITADMDDRGYWVESQHLLMIEGEMVDGKVHIWNDVLAHEIKHMLHHDRPDLFDNPQRNRKQAR